MNVKWKWALALAPFFIAGCTEELLPGGKPGTATSGDEVQFAVASSFAETRTVYEDNWDKNPQSVFWGSYLTGTDKKEEYINIYCPTNPGRGFAKYLVTPNEQENKDYAADVQKANTDEVGVQWGTKGPHTFYAFYPADKAGSALDQKEDGSHIIRATIDAGQSPVSYKYKLNTADKDEAPTAIDNFYKYLSDNYKNNAVVDKEAAKTIYCMPDMEAAAMVAHSDMTEAQFGEKVPLEFNVLADVLDITINGPTTPNSLGGNANPNIEGDKGIQADFIQIQAITIDVVKRPNSTDATDPKEYEIDFDTPISGTFDLDMSKVPELNATVTGTGTPQGLVSNVKGSPTIMLQTLTTSTDGSTTRVNYPTLFVRNFTDDNKNLDDLDHMRVRAFLVPGQITKDNITNLRIHVQTNCGDFYQMLSEDGSYVSGQIYPVKLGYFKTRGTNDFDLERWIGQLDPNIYISELSIPGAWHSSNTNYQGNVTMQNLYHAGIRAFEVHSINGTIPYTDYTFKTELTTSNVNTMEFHDTHLNEETSQSSFIVDGGENSWSNWGTQVTGENKTVTETRTIKYDMLPKLYLRLYRTSNITENNNNPENSMSDAIIDLAKTMTSTGFIFLEFGWDDGGFTRTVNVPMKTVTVTQKRTKTGVTLTGTGVGWNVQTWNTDNVFNDTDPWETTIETPSYSKETILSSEEAWCIAINSCINRLKNTVNPTTQKTIIYEPEITAETTISDVQGRVIFKVNTNNNKNEGSMTTGIGWEKNTPALFSRWIDGSAKEPLTINLQWGSGIAPYDQGDKGSPNSDLRWCFTEVDNINRYCTIKERQDAITKMNEIAAKNYADGLHRTFYESMFGGYATTPENESDEQVKTCQYVAKTMNTFVLNRLSDPTRQNVPIGLAFMNYAIAPKKAGSTTEEEEGYNSAALIRTIINNNKAFLLHRRNANTPAPNVEESTNSHFNNNSQNPLK